MGVRRHVEDPLAPVGGSDVYAVAVLGLPGSMHDGVDGLGELEIDAPEAGHRVRRDGTPGGGGHDGDRGLGLGLHLTVHIDRDAGVGDVRDLGRDLGIGGVVQRGRRSCAGQEQDVHGSS